MCYRQIIDNLVASLILNLQKSYYEIMDMDIEDAIYTYSVFYINSINLSIAGEVKK